MRTKVHLAILALVFVAAAISARADVSLSGVIGSGMVIQRDRPAAIWGWAAPGEKVTLLIGGKPAGSAEGRGAEIPWKIMLPAQKAGPVPEITVSGSNTIALTNVLAGNVWVCSGQSNMVMTVVKGPWCGYGGANNGEQEAASANDPQLRLFTVGRGGSATPSLVVSGSWAAATPDSVKSASATAYFFGRELRAQLHVPIGLVISAVGGTAVEPWTPRKALDGDADFAALEAGAKSLQQEFAARDAADGKLVAAWKKAVAEAQAKGQPTPPQPAAQLTPDQHFALSDAGPILGAGGLYNGKIHPLTPMTIEGVIWYQGESNARRGAHYAHSLTKMIEGWREAFGRQFPFLIVQLANFGPPTIEDHRLGSFPLVREAQEKVAENVPGAGIITAVDIGDARQIHPGNKQEVGRRLAQLALKQVYGRDVTASGPVFAGARFQDGKAVVAFRPDAGELLLKGPGGFELAGEDHKFAPAVAVLKDGAIEVSAPGVPKPVAVRYAFLNAPECTVYNKAGWPALPFRSDDWK